MDKKALSRCILLVASMIIAVVPAAAEIHSAILRILVVDVNGDPASYVKEVERGKPILKRLGIEAEIRVWQATYAGKETGTVIVTLEFADESSFARSEEAFTKAKGDREYDAWVKSLVTARKITSDSLFEELDGPGSSKK